MQRLIPANPLTQLLRAVANQAKHRAVRRWAKALLERGEGEAGTKSKPRNEVNGKCRK